MTYDKIDKDTKVLFVNGMDNNLKEAKSSQESIQKDFGKTGLFNNHKDKVLGIVGDVIEWMPNYMTTKDVLNAHQLQKLKKGTPVITHSARNEDIYKANKINKMLNAKTPYKNISVGSPLSSTKLKESLYKVDATFIKQINNENDPVANGLLNEDANYEVKDGLIDDIEKNHPFESYYPKVKKSLINEENR